MLLKSGTLYEKIRSLVSEYSLPTHSEDSIHAARKARNNIAHSICIELKNSCLVRVGVWLLEQTSCVKWMR
ncbi:TPA: DUF4145 domain-containing protein [Vibrio diabolicus]